MRAPAGPPVGVVEPGGCGAGVVVTLIVGCVIEGCAWNDGGFTIVPAGVPGASVGAGAADAGGARPVNACCQERAELLGALVLQVVDVEARTVAGAGLIESRDPLLRLRRDTRVAA